MFSRPALFVAACLAAGLWLRRAFPFNTTLTLSFAAILFVATILVWRFVPRMLLPVLAISVMAAGVALGTLTIQAEQTGDPALRVIEDKTEHLVYVTVDNDPTSHAGGLSFHAILHAVHDSNGTHALGDVGVRVYCGVAVGDTLPVIRHGDKLALFARVRAIAGIRNPGDFDYHEYLTVQGTMADVIVRSASNAEHVGSDPPHPFIAFLENVRRYIGEALDRNVGGEEGNVLKGLLIGERGDMLVETREAFIATGTFHILAVSGLHVAFVALMLYGVLSPVLNRYIHAALLIIALLAFAVIAGGAPSIYRAVVMAVLATTGMLLERRIDALNIVGGAACILLFIDPVRLFSAGFQLSFCAALGLAMIQPRLRALLVRGNIAKYRSLRWATELACASVAAQCATLPLTALYFERVSPGGILANLVIVPAAGLALGSAILIAIMAPFTWLAAVIGDTAREFVRGILWIAQSLSHLPAASYAIQPFTLIDSVLYVIAVLFVIYGRTRAAFFRRVLIVLFAWGAFTLAPFHSDGLLPAGRLTVAVLDVGQGDGIVIRFPNRRVLAIDTGPEHLMRTAPGPVPAFLMRQGVGHVDALVLTHLHADHIGGAGELLHHVIVDTVYHSGERASDGRVYALDSLIAALHIPVRRLVDGEMLVLDSAARVYVLHPDTTVVGSDGKTADGNLNDGSVVLKIQYGQTSMLFSGDLEHDRELALTNHYGDFLRADILKAGHHGSRTSSTPEYLAAVRPRVAIISVGENRFGHPSAEVLSRLQNLGIEVDRTDEQGAVIWQSDGKQWTSLHWRGADSTVHPH